MADVKEKKDKTITAKVTAVTERKLKALAKKRERPVSYVINQILTVYFQS